MNDINKFPTNPYNDKYSSLIRTIKIFLPSRTKESTNDSSEYDDFVGRERLMERLFNWLSDKSIESGSYLVTGFRGMGKTKLVERVTNRLTREVKVKEEPWWLLFNIIPVIIVATFFACLPLLKDCNHSTEWIIAIVASLMVWISAFIIIYRIDQRHFVRKKNKERKKYPNNEEFDDVHVDKMARGKKDDNGKKNYNNIKISINLGHEVLKERDVLSMIATSVRDKYKAYVKSVKPHLAVKSGVVLIVSLLSFGPFVLFQFNFNVNLTSNINYTSTSVRQHVSESSQVIVSEKTDNSSNQQIVVNGDTGESWFSRMCDRVAKTSVALYVDPGCWGIVFRFLLYVLTFIIIQWVCKKTICLIPYFSAPKRALRRLDFLTERLNTITGEDTGIAPSAQNSLFSFSLFSYRKRKTKPIADIREIETELADIINVINSNSCPKNYRVKFIVVFDEMDKIDPDMVEPPKGSEMPEFTDSVKGFPDGMDSRERRRNVLKLLANIKLFVSTAKAKFVFISGRELYDAYLADLSDRDFAISSIFTGVINVDSFLTPEGGQTDVRSMSEWYIANRLIPYDWLENWEKKNALKCDTLKQEKPSLRWYYQYLIEKCGDDEEKHKDVAYVMGFLHTFAAYLTHISNGSPKKIFLYFDKYIRKAVDCLPMNDWGDTCTVGEDLTSSDKEQCVLYFDYIQQKTINFVYYLANPIMGTITNDLSNYGDRFLVSLSFIIDHIYKHHNRSFSWRNMEQIPDLLKTSKAPELRDSVMSIMEYLTQIHISPILIGLNEYKFHKSIAEEISMMSKLSDEASAIFNFTLDESLSVIQHNTRMLNYYIEIDKADKQSEKSRRDYLPIIARIHSNLGDLRYWDEDYYAASLEYRAAIDVFKRDDVEGGFLSLLRCMLKLGLTYESRHLYPNAYQLYCQLMDLLIKKRWIRDDEYRLTTKAMYVDDWRGKRQVMIGDGDIHKYDTTFSRQFNHGIAEYDDEVKKGYSVNVDGVISSFASDLTPEKSATINALTLFEEVRYVYQAILAKLSVLEKMGMSGITQTNISVAEGEFIAIHKSVNIKEKFIISADFFRKLAEILYYKNSLTILSQNQDSFYASVYYDDYDMLANLDDYCLYGTQNKHGIVGIKHDVKLFFNNLDNVASTNTGHPQFQYRAQGNRCFYKDLFSDLRDNLGDYLDIMGNNGLFDGRDRTIMEDNIREYLNYNINVKPNEQNTFYYGSVASCDYHCHEMRKRGLRPPCYACKYYTRSLRILADNMFADRTVLENELTKSYGILKCSFKSDLLYTGANHILTLAQTLEGFGNVMFACVTGDDMEGKAYQTGKGITPQVITLLRELCVQTRDEDERKVIDRYELKLKKLSRLDKSILYYWDAYRFYLINSQYNEAVGVLNKIMTLFSYYVQVLCYFQHSEKPIWKDEVETIKVLIGGTGDMSDSFISKLFSLIVRYTGFKYDHTNLTEITELKWIYSKELRDVIDLTRLSLYPNIRAAWLRAIEIRAKGLHYLSRKLPVDYTQIHYLKFIKEVYPLITPKRRYETTFYEEVLAYYTKLRFNEHIMNNLMGRNTMLNRKHDDYSGVFHIAFFEKLAEYIDSDDNRNRMDGILFDNCNKTDDRLKLIEFLIHDSIVCITNMVKVFTPHNHLTSYSSSFIGITYNYYWEWSRRYELLYSLYQYHDFKKRGDSIGQKKAEKIIDNIVGAIREGDPDENRKDLRKALDECSRLLLKCPVESSEKYGEMSDQFYERVRHDIDDITIGTIYSNYTAEMAINYYKKSEEANTEGEAYKEMMGTMHFLNDDLNNDTCQFNIACDRFLLNCGVVAEQRRRLEKLYKASNIYNMQNAYINTPGRINSNPVVTEGQFDRSQFINSEY